jgi:hypothetical protein
VVEFPFLRARHRHRSGISERGFAGRRAPSTVVDAEERRAGCRQQFRVRAVVAEWATLKEQVVSTAHSVSPSSGRQPAIGRWTAFRSGRRLIRGRWERAAAPAVCGWFGPCRYDRACDVRSRCVRVHNPPRTGKQAVAHHRAAAASSSNRIISARLISSAGLAPSLGRRAAQGRSLEPRCESGVAAARIPRKLARNVFSAAAYCFGDPRADRRLGRWRWCSARACLPAASTRQMGPPADRGALLDAADPTIHHHALNAASRYSDTEFPRALAPEEPSEASHRFASFLHHQPLPPSAEAFRQFAPAYACR